MDECEGLRDLIGVYLSDALSEAEAARVTSHLASCAACREEFAERRRLVAALPPAVPTAAERECMIRAVRVGVFKAEGAQTRVWARRTLTAVGVTTAAAALFMGGVLFGQHRGTMRGPGSAQIARPPRPTPVAVVRRELLAPPPALQTAKESRHRPRNMKHRLESSTPSPVVQPLMSTPAPPLPPTDEMAATRVARVTVPAPEGVDDISLAVTRE